MQNLWRKLCAENGFDNTKNIEHWGINNQNNICFSFIYNTITRVNEFNLGFEIFAKKRLVVRLAGK